MSGELLNKLIFFASHNFVALELWFLLIIAYHIPSNKIVCRYPILPLRSQNILLENSYIQNVNYLLVFLYSVFNKYRSIEIRLHPSC